MAFPTIIFGGAGGVGAALARRLSASGRPVHLVGRTEATLSALAGELNASYTVADVLEPGAAQRAVAAAVGGGGGLAGLAYCVGSIVLKPLKSATAQDFIDAFRLNVVGAAEAAQAAVPALTLGDGAILLFSTVAVRQGFANHTVIAAAKGGVEGLTVALAAELAPKIRVNAIAPSLTRTPLATAFTANEAMAKAVAQLHPLQRLGEPDDVAAMAATLLDPALSGWITGQVIGVDGGRSTLRTKG